MLTWNERQKATNPSEATEAIVNCLQQKYQTIVVGSPDIACELLGRIKEYAFLKGVPFNMDEAYDQALKAYKDYLGSDYEDFDPYEYNQGWYASLC